MEETYLTRWRYIGVGIATVLVIFGIFAAPLHSRTFANWDYAAIATVVTCELIGRVVERRRSDW